MLVLLAPVAHKLETADDLANGEEANDLSGNHTHRVPLSGGDVSDLCENVGGLLGGAVGLASHAGHAVEDGARVTEGVQSGLDVVLHGLDGSKSL